MDKNISKFVKILITAKIAFAAMFYFEQFFLLYMLINKNVWEWFLLIIYREHILPKLQTFFIETIWHPILNEIIFWILIKAKVCRCPLLNSYFIKSDKRGCLCDNWKPSFLPPIIFNWSIFSRQVTARWSRGWVKNQVSPNQDLRNRWPLIARQTIWKTATGGVL